MMRQVIETPVGPMLAVASDRALCALEFMDSAPDASPPFGAMRTGRSRESRLKDRLARWYGAPALADGSNAAIDLARGWLDAYFAGERADIGSLPLDMRGAPFEQRVWEALRQLGPGEITTYGAIAKQLGAPGASRAVGMANGANPIAIIVPCHRVIGRNGTLTGYGGGLDRKTWLLNHERRWRNALPL